MFLSKLFTAGPLGAMIAFARWAQGGCPVCCFADDMTPEQKTAADAAAKVASDAKAKADADAAAADAAKPKDAAYWEREAKNAFVKRDEATRQLKDLTPKAAEYDKIVEAQKSEQQRATDALARVATLEADNKTATASLQRYYDLEAATVPDDKRALIPELPLAQRLDWLKNAKEKGLFGDPNLPGPSGRANTANAGLSTMTAAEFNALAINPAKLAEATKLLQEGKLKLITE